jgi:PAS domain S-box-containing protein
MEDPTPTQPAVAAPPPAWSPPVLDAAELLAGFMDMGCWSRETRTGDWAWDAQMFRIYGCDPSAPPPTPQAWLSEHVHALDRARIASRIALADARWESSTQLVFRIQREDSGDEREHWVQSWSRRLQRDGRDFAFGLHLDVSARQRAQMQTRREHDRMRFAIEAADVGVWERDPQGRLVYWSDAMYRQRGLDPSDPRTPAELAELCTDAADLSELSRLFRQHLATGEPYRHEVRVRRPGGEQRWLATEGHTLRDGEGALVGVIGVHVDITERKQAEALRLEKQRIEQAGREQSAFMARMSHELRTPMNAVLGFTRLLQDDPAERPSQRQREQLARIAQAGSELLALIDHLLDLSRLGVTPAPDTDHAGLPPEQAQAQAQAQALADAPSQRRLEVLCVEDNPVNLQLVRELLSLRPGVHLRTATDGHSGLQAALAARPDLMLLDVHLPDFSGTELMRRLRTEPAMAGCRYVALSADAMPEHIELARAAGFDDYWTKPIDFDRFLAHIDRLIAAPRP